MLWPATKFTHPNHVFGGQSERSSGQQRQNVVFSHLTSVQALICSGKSEPQDNRHALRPVLLGLARQRCGCPQLYLEKHQRLAHITNCIMSTRQMRAQVLAQGESTRAQTTGICGISWINCSCAWGGVGTGCEQFLQAGNTGGREGEIGREGPGALATRSIS